MTVAAWMVAAVVGLLTAHAGVNARWLRRPPAQLSPVDIDVAVLVPVRDEADRIGLCLRGLRAQRGAGGLAILVGDDGSTDGTAAVVRAVAGGDPRVRLLTVPAPPPGWLGKPHACHQLAAATTAPVLIFVDADVVLAPDAIAATLALLAGVDLVSPYPRVRADGAQRLVQPLLQWSWLTFLPLPAMERSARPALAAAGGQLLAVRREAYERAGGHAAVRAEILDDIALARAVKRSGGRIALADGAGIATCQMYRSWAELVAGYTKSLWAAFGSPRGAVGAGLLLGALYVLPPMLAIAGAVAGRPGLAAAGLAGYVFGVLGRVVAARASRTRIWPDVLAHPVSIVLFGWLLTRSLYRRRRGELSWKGRPV
ncbi:MAG: glycosyltransferase [Micromonosporaceae bacterium]